MKAMTKETAFTYNVTLKNKAQLLTKNQQL
ncbi:unknown [Prevotella sp. CAG:5226]|nr:unknown [Prevotella sp. CAG:5226]